MVSCLTDSPLEILPKMPVEPFSFGEWVGLLNLKKWGTKLLFQPEDDFSSPWRTTTQSGKPQAHEFGAHTAED